jgi:hypothetical protein
MTSRFVAFAPFIIRDASLDNALLDCLAMMSPSPKWAASGAKLTGHGLWNSDIATKVPLVAGLP